MGDLSAHFSRREFRCPCCDQDTVDAELLYVLERLRSHLGRAVSVSSGNRCTRRNASIGGARKSLHLSSKAADIQVDGLAAEFVADLLDEWYPTRYGIGRYHDWTHIDVRPIRARWSEQ